MSRHSWKKAELALARYLHGERVPVTGRVRGWAPDIEHQTLALEVKTRKNMPLLLKQGMAQAVAAAGWYVRKGKGERLPALVIHEDGSHFENSLVVVRLKDAQEWWGFGELKESTRNCPFCGATALRKEDEFICHNCGATGQLWLAEGE